jgi:hypothetical protein
MAIGLMLCPLIPASRKDQFLDRWNLLATRTMSPASLIHCHLRYISMPTICSCTLSLTPAFPNLQYPCQLCSQNQNVVLIATSPAECQQDRTIIWFGSRANLNRIASQSLSLSIGTEIVTSVDTVRDLGVLFDSQLTLDETSYRESYRHLFLSSAAATANTAAMRAGSYYATSAGLY